MQDYDASTYGERIAEVYDELYPPSIVVQPMVEVLAELARGGRTLELGIGTGRVALPLAARGIEVHGIDASRAMIAKLRGKEGGATIPVHLGDFAEVGVEGSFSLIFVVANTFFILDSQEAQVRCFRNVAQHLTEDGVFVIEAFVPDLSRFVRGQNIEVTNVSVDKVMLDVTRHDGSQQRIVSQEVLITETGTRLLPVQLRYAWPPSLT